MDYKLSELFDLQMGKTPSRDNPAYWDSPQYAWISIADLTSAGKYITDTKESLSALAVEESGIKVIPAQTVVMSFKLSIGKVAITPVPMYSNEAIMAFVDKGIVKIDPEYLYYLSLHRDWEEGTNKAVMGKTLNKATLSNVMISIHSYEEQREIVLVLNRVSTIIDEYKLQLRTLDQLIKARFVEMFGDYQDIVQLSDVAEVTGGLTKNGNRDRLPLKLPYLRVANVSFASIDTTEMLSIGLTEEERSKTTLQYGDLLFVEGNGSPDQIGRVAIWHDEVVPCVHQNHIIKARLNESKMLPSFAMHYYMSQKGRDQIKKKAVSTSGLYTLSVSKISGFVMPCPPLDRQIEFAALVAQVDKSKVVDLSVFTNRAKSYII